MAKKITMAAKDAEEIGSKCDECDGMGKVKVECDECDGKGKVSIK